jgi:hypothetical protein
MRRHEIAHCNGWPGYHPGGHSVEYDPDRRAPARKSGGVTITFE